MTNHSEAPLEDKSAKDIIDITSFQKRLLTTLVALLVGIGVFIRFKGLAWHFTNADDMAIVHMCLKYPQDFFAVAKQTTYAPLQFIFSQLLITKDLGYREFLFWGRLIPCLNGIATIIVGILIYRRYEKNQIFNLIFLTTLMISSWMLIIHSRQMHAYALGVLLVFGAFLFLLHLLERTHFPLKLMAGAGLYFGFLCWGQYQLLFFLPSLYLTLFIYALRHDSKASLKETVIKFFIAGMTTLATLVPLWYFFLRLNSERIHPEGEQRWGISYWNRGAHDEFFFQLPAGENLWGALKYIVTFLSGNFYWVFQSNLAFLPEDHILLTFITDILFILFFLGIISSFLTKSRIKRYMALCIGLLAVTWIILLWMQLITLSPTRHSLILIGPMLIMITEGLTFILDAIFGEKATGKKGLIKLCVPVFLSSIILILFLTHFSVFLEERRNKFEEKEILSLLEKYDVTYVVYGYVDSLHLMKSVKPYIDRNSHLDYTTVAWISRSGPVDFLSYIQSQPCCTTEKYQLIHKEERDSNREVDFSIRAKYSNVQNRQFIYVARRIS